MNKQHIFVAVGALSIIAVGAIVASLIMTSGRVSIDTASVQAPLIGLTSTVPGVLDAVYVHTGDVVSANQVVASVGTQVISTKVAGLVVSVNDAVGAQVNAGVAIVTMIDPSQLRVVGRIDENKGFSDIRVGNPVTFTVDAFGSKKFTGVIDEVAPTSNQSGIVFNISSQRQVQQFAVKARFDTSAYPEIKNGMSARMEVYTK
jgi:multidrug resistance efflux pump